MSMSRRELERDRGARWEKAMLGADTADRVVTMGNDIRDWRARASGMESTAEDQLQSERFGAYVSSLGRDVLQMVSSKDADADAVAAKVNAKNKAIEAKKRLKRKNVSVAGMESGGESAKMDEEWDTSAWTDEMVEDGVLVLFDVFYDDETRRDEFRKNRASLMLEKLVNRHAVAEAYVRKNVPLLVGLAANRFVKGGQSLGLLDLLYILHAARSKYVFELSENNFVGRCTDMALLEARSATLIIQHAVRSHTARKNTKIRRAMEAGTLIATFGLAEESEIISESNIVGRAMLLKSRWASMHMRQQSLEERHTPMGFRGPVHIGHKYLMLVMEISLTLVSEASGEMAQCNREELLRCNGCVLYNQFLGFPHGPYASLAAQILSHVSRIAESLAPIMHSGCIKSGMRCIKFFQRTGKLAWANSGNKQSSALLITSRRGAIPTAAEVAMEVARVTFLDILAMFVNSSAHAAAIYRARNDFDYFTPQSGTVESNDYRRTLHLSQNLLTEDQLKSHLASRAVLCTFMDLVKDVSSLHLIRGALRFFYNLACSDCYNSVLVEVTACGGKNMLRLFELLDESDATVGSLVLGLFLQLCTQDNGRSGLVTTYLASMLASRTKCTSVYSRKPYLRALLVATASIRHGVRKTYNPLKMPHLLADAEAMRKLVYLDLLKSIKHPPLDQADGLSIPDLVVWPFSKSHSQKVSENASRVLGAGVGVWAGTDSGSVVADICDFLCHPNEEQYFASLPWDESAAGCVILDGLTRTPETSALCMSAGTIRYLCHCLYYGRMLIKDGPVMAEPQLLIVLKAVTSACAALANICNAASDFGATDLIETVIAGLHQVDVVFATSYFINTLAQNHPLVDEAVKKIQIKTGRGALVFFDSYCRMIMEATHLQQFEPKRREMLLLEMAEVGKAATALVHTCKMVHGGTPSFLKLFDGMCTFLARLLSRDRSLVEVAIGRWKLPAALRQHLPEPLTALGELGVDDEAYKEGLGALPASFFDICWALSSLDKGKAACLADGFLRRAVEKVVMLAPSKLEAPHQLQGWTFALERIQVDLQSGQEYSLDLLPASLGQPGSRRFRPSTARLEVASALRLIARCASFASPQFGSANDVLLAPEYDFVRICKSLIAVPEAPRCDPVVTAAIQVLGGLSTDVYRVAPRFEELDILGLLATQMAQVPLLPRAAVESCLEVVNRMAATGSEYVVDQLRNLREPLLKVTRVVPALAKAVGDTNWNATNTFLRFERAEQATLRAWGGVGGGGAGGGGVVGGGFGTSAAAADQPSTPSSAVFEDDRILREQLQKLYTAAGLEEEAQQLSPSKLASTKPPSRPLQSTPPPPVTPSPLASPAPSPSKGPLRLDALSPRSGGGGSGLPSPASLSSSAASSPSKSNSSMLLLSPIVSSRGLAASSRAHAPSLSLPLSPSASRKAPKNGKTVGGGGGRAKASPVLTLRTEDIDELRFTRPSL